MPPTQPGIEADTASLIKLRLDARALQTGFTPGSRSVLAGSHASKFRGRGMDFAESRVYMPGDDIRSIDWRVTARSGTTHTKVYIEERERPVFLLMDFSPSMYFGTRNAFKSVIAARAAALLTWSTVAQGDRIGGIIFTPDQVSELKPRPGRRGALAMMHALSQATRLPNNSHRAHLLDTALQHASRVVHPGSLVLVFSDFYDVGQQTERYLSRLRRHNDLLACQILDPFESDAPQSGLYPITDGKIRTTLDTRQRASRESFREISRQRNENLDTVLRKTGIALLTLKSDQDLVQQLRQNFSSRKQ